MESHEQHIAGHEFDQVHLLLLRQAVHQGRPAHFAHRVIHLGGGDRTRSRRRLRACRHGSERESQESQESREQNAQATK
jgi:hypothetical protein